jgi:hypothetical protein
MFVPSGRFAIHLYDPKTRKIAVKNIRPKQTTDAKKTVLRTDPAWFAVNGGFIFSGPPKPRIEHEHTRCNLCTLFGTPHLKAGACRIGTAACTNVDCLGDSPNGEPNIR